MLLKCDYGNHDVWEYRPVLPVAAQVPPLPLPTDIVDGITCTLNPYKRRSCIPTPVSKVSISILLNAFTSSLVDL